MKPETLKYYDKKKGIIDEALENHSTNGVKISQKTEKIFKHIYNIENKDLLSSKGSVTLPETDLVTFFRNILPERVGSNSAYFLQTQSDFISELGGIRITQNHTYKTSKNEFIDVLLKVINQAGFTVFYSNNLFSRRTKEPYLRAVKDNVISSRAIYIDIDDVEDINKIDRKNVGVYLKSQYGLSEEQLPNYVVFSGHGMHLYYRTPDIILDSEQNKMLRDRVVAGLIGRFDGDKSGRPACHMIRVPGSNNLKHGQVIPTELVVLDHNKVLSWTEFEESFPVLQSDSANKTITKKEKPAPKAQKTIFRSRDDIIGIDFEADKKSKKKHLIGDKICNPAMLFKIRRENVHGRYQCVEADLHNFYVRHGGLREGIRNKFFFIFALAYRTMVPGATEGECRKHLLRYIPDNHSFIAEAERAIASVFKMEKVYFPNNKMLADWLEFSDEDKAMSFSTFADVAKDNPCRKNLFAAAWYRKKQTLAGKKMKSEEISERLKYIEEHPFISVSRLAKRFGVSCRQVQRYRAVVRSRCRYAAQRARDFYRHLVDAKREPITLKGILEFAPIIKNKEAKMQIALEHLIGYADIKKAKNLIANIILAKPRL